MMGSGQADLIEQSDWPRLVGSMGWRARPYSAVRLASTCQIDERARLTLLSSPTGLDSSDRWAGVAGAILRSIARACAA